MTCSVEFIGVPASGKTSIARELTTALQTRGLDAAFASPHRDLEPRARQAAIKAPKLALHALLRSRDASDLRASGMIVRRAAYARNARNRARWLILDQGPLWHVAASHGQGSKRMLPLRSHITLPDLLVWVDVDSAVAAQRSRDRAAQDQAGEYPEQISEETANAIRQGVTELLPLIPCPQLRVDSERYGAEEAADLIVSHMLQEGLLA